MPRNGPSKARRATKAAKAARYTGKGTFGTTVPARHHCKATRGWHENRYPAYGQRPTLKAGIEQ